MTQPSGEVKDPAQEIDSYQLPDNPHHDDEDVPAALSSETDDGKGGAVVPKADFESYTDPDADKADES